MTGTLINIATILVGGSLGLLLGSRFPTSTRQTVVNGLGLFTLVLGVSMFMEMQNPVIAIASLLLGALLGEWWRIETALVRLGERLEARWMPAGDAEHGGSRFVRGFLTASLLFCIGPMTILGSIQDGLVGDYSLLAIKAVLDGFAALAFASTFGVGVLFSIVVVLVYQGGLSLLAAQTQSLFSAAMIADMTAVGGVLLVGLALSSLLEIKPIRTTNLLPALVLAPLIVWIVAGLGLG